MVAQRSILVLVLILLLVVLLPPRADGLQLGQWRTLLSLSHSLMTRVANARAARGDIPGAGRATKIADHLQLVGRGGAGIWSMGWDFAWNYAWRGGLPTAETSRATAELHALLGEVSRLQSSAERAAWALRSYARLRTLSNSLIRSLLNVFSRSGPLREAVLVLQREVSQGELLRDCLEVGAGDLEGLIRIARDIFFSETSSHDEF